MLSNMSEAERGKGRKMPPSRSRDRQQRADDGGIAAPITIVRSTGHVEALRAGGAERRTSGERRLAQRDLVPPSL
jgi:hypothetical protein